jgi:hypothetical protein
MKSNPEYNAFKDRIRELEDEVARYRRREEQTELMLQRIAAITEEREAI